MSNAVGLTNLELSREMATAPLPDIESPNVHWHGSAGSQVEYWRRRALAAEGEIRGIRAEIAEYFRRPR